MTQSFFYSSTRTSSRSAWFSTLMALGTIAVLLLIVTGLASTYMREMKLSRASYDEVVALGTAEGMFEYAMLKVRNHREWFADIVDHTDIDGNILIPITDRSKNMKSSYSIKASSNDYTVKLHPNNHLILPLFTSTGSYISGLSRNPQQELWSENTQELSVSLGQTSWTIIAMSWSESMWLTGSGDITPVTLGNIRKKVSRCYSHHNATEIPCGQLNLLLWDEELEYFYDESIVVSDFMRMVSSPYLMVFNTTNTPQQIHIQSRNMFALPTLTIRSEAQKNNSLQVFEFTEDKSKYYDALKYGIYNN